MTDINELNIPDPKKEELIRQRQARIDAIATMPDDDPVKADKLLGPITDEKKNYLLGLLDRVSNNLVNRKLKK